VATLDRFVGFCLFPLAVWILISGLDDLFLEPGGGVELAPPAAAGRASGGGAGRAELEACPRSAWPYLCRCGRNTGVIGRMLERNLASVRLLEVRLFRGRLSQRRAHNGRRAGGGGTVPETSIWALPARRPDSKADCLNWIYQNMLVYEERHGVRFEAIVLHDAEDLIHPEELRWINYYLDGCGMVQIPVLPLPTPAWKFTHGVYCDEFAEYQSKDVPVRELLGGFVPSNGVGTGFARWAVEKLAEKEGNRIFDPGSLTEDYDAGLRLHRLGCAQAIRTDPSGPRRAGGHARVLPPGRREGPAAANTMGDGHFASGLGAHGWRAGWRQGYWLWRDRKGLIGNPVTLAANAILLYGLATWLWSRHTAANGVSADSHSTWGPRSFLDHAVPGVGTHGSALRVRDAGLRMAVRTRDAAPHVVGNSINFLATARALIDYAVARAKGRPLVWVRRNTVIRRGRRCPDPSAGWGDPGGIGLLGRAGSCGPRWFRSRRVADREHLMAQRLLDEHDLYEALSLQQMVPFERLDPAQVPLGIARALPAAQARRWKVLPFKVSAGRLYVAGPELPTTKCCANCGNTPAWRFSSSSSRRETCAELMDQLLGQERAAS